MKPKGSSTMLKELLPAQVKQIQNPEVTVYTTEVCPKCQRLKTFLQAQGIPFKTLDMQSPEGLAELRFNGCFALEAPVLQVGEEFFTTRQIFQGNEIDPCLPYLLLAGGQ